jgi:hypothetical protein
MNRQARIVLAAILIAVLLPALVSACPLCKDAKSDTDYPGGSASLPKGFYYSILLMVSSVRRDGRSRAADLSGAAAEFRTADRRGAR